MSFSGGWKKAPRPLFSGLNLSLDRGDIVGLYGSSGAGKSTLGDLLLGLLRPKSGRVLWQGEDIHGGARGPMAKLRTRYQKLFQDPAASFYPRQSIWQSMLELIRLHGLAPDDQAARRLIEVQLPDLGLEPEMLERLPEQLSGGEIQRLALARITLLQPWFLVADEPTSRLDLSVQAQVARLLAGWSRRQQAALLFISHDLDLLGHICQRIYRLEPDGFTTQAE